MKIEQRKNIAESYKNWTPRSSPYSYGDWNKLMSPIEKELFEDMRFHGITMYPEFPVGPYFLDFADPERKICVEADGREFHQDYEKDQERDKYLNNLGWTVFRLSGSSIRRQDRLYKSTLQYLKLPRNDRPSLEYLQEQEDLQNSFV